MKIIKWLLHRLGVELAMNQKVDEDTYNQINHYMHKIEKIIKDIK